MCDTERDYNCRWLEWNGMVWYGMVWMDWYGRGYWNLVGRGKINYDVVMKSVVDDDIGFSLGMLVWISE